MILNSDQHYTVMGERGRRGGGGGNPASRTLQSRNPPPLFLTLSLFFSITKYWPLLRNFPPFLSLLLPLSPLPPRVPLPPIFPLTSTNTWIDCGLSMVSLAEGGGGGAHVGKVVQGSKPPALHTLHSWLPFLYLNYLPLGLLRLRNIEHCCVFSPISLASHP